MVHATLIYNPIAGGRIVDLAAAQALLVAHGWNVRDARTSAAGDATRLAHEAVARGDDVVVVAGGDGTINEAVQALAGSATALGVLPVGTVNVWAREIRLPLDPMAAAKALIDGVWRRIDLGRAGDRYFLLMAGVGFDGAVTDLVEPRLKRAVGPWAYVLTGARLALRYGGPEATLELDGATIRCRLLLAIIGNTRFYGGSFAMTGDAVADDGLLDVVVFPGRYPWEAIPRALPILLGRRRHASAIYYRTRRIRITTKTPVPAQADGDYIGTTPLDISAVPSALCVVVPRDARSPLFSLPSAPAASNGDTHAT